MPNCFIKTIITEEFDSHWFNEGGLYYVEYKHNKDWCSKGIYKCTEIFHLKNPQEVYMRNMINLSSGKIEEFIIISKRNMHDIVNICPVNLKSEYNPELKSWTFKGEVKL